MKKRVFLAILMIMAFVFALAISASAKTFTYENKEIEIVDNLGDPSWYTGDTALAIQDKESIVILKDSEGNMTAYPSYYIFRYYIEKKDGQFTIVRITWSDQNGIDYSFINEQLGEEKYTYGSLYYLELPYGLTTCFGGSKIWGADSDTKLEPNVVEIVIPDSVTTIESQAFRRMNSCKKVTMPKNLISIADWAFCGSTKLETVVFPEGCTLETTGNSFSGCTALSSINLENCKSLRVLGGNLFNGCTSLNYLNLPDSIQIIRDQAFYKMGQLEFASDYLPKSLTTIGGVLDSWGNENAHFLSGCKLVNDVLYFPEGFTSLTSKYNFNDGFNLYDNGGVTFVFLGKMTTLNLSNLYLADIAGGIRLVFAQNSFEELNGDFLQSVLFKDKHAYIVKNGDESTPYTTKTSGALTVTLNNNNPNTGTNLGTDENGNTIFQAEGAPASLIFCGSDTVEFCYSVRNSNTDKGWYRFFTTEWTYDMEAHATSNEHFSSKVYQERNCGYDECTTYTCVICDLVNKVYTDKKATGEHSCEDDFNCETALVCAVCEITLKEALSHDIQVTIAYENGFTMVGLKTTACANDGCSICEEAETQPIFNFLGFSTKDDASGASLGITFGYKVNIEELEAYEKENGALSSYGFVVAFKALLGDNTPIKADGSVNTVDGCNIIVAGTNSTEQSALTTINFVLTGPKELWESDDYQIGDAATLKDAELVMAGYVIEDGAISYFQDRTVQAVQALEAQTYNGVCGA